MLNIRVVNQGPLYERLMNRWRELHGPGYISAYVLFLATPTGDIRMARNWKTDPTPIQGVWFLPIVTGLFTGDPGDRLRTLAERLLEATLRFMSELDLGEPLFLEVPDLQELWPTVAGGSRPPR